jgi:tetratricopeptide (TPR) repeat protein
MVRRSLLIAFTSLAAFASASPAEGQQGDQAAASVPVVAAKDQGTTPAQPEVVLPPEKRGDIFMAHKQYREAIEKYRETKETAVICNKLGIAYHQLLDFQTARRYYQRSIKLDPKYPEAANNLGTIFYAQKQYGRAISQYKKALRLAPDSASFYSNLGTAYFARKDYKRAFDAYEQAVKLDPGVFEHRGTFGEAIRDTTVEERSRFHFYLAKVYAKSGMTDRALLFIRKALEEGFKERNKFLEDPEFATLQDNPEFKQLMAQAPRVL